MTKINDSRYIEGVSEVDDDMSDIEFAEAYRDDSVLGFVEVEDFDAYNDFFELDEDDEFDDILFSERTSFEPDED